MKINRSNNEKNVATLSIVLSITTYRIKSIMGVWGKFHALLYVPKQSETRMIP